MAITTRDLTTVSVNGTGVFDELMKATKAHLEDEYKANRIRGKEYADVYLGSLVAVLDQAVKFLQVKQQDRLVDAQIAEIEARKELIKVQKANAVIEGQNLVLQGQLIDKQALKIEEELALIPVQLNKLVQETEVLTEQVTKTRAEKEFIKQKHLTEIAQILDGFPDWNDNNVTVAGVIGKQKELYAAQRDGFERKAQESAAKLLADIWSVQRTTDEGVRPPATVDYVGRAIAEVVNNSGITTKWTPPPVDS